MQIHRLKNRGLKKILIHGTEDHADIIKENEQLKETCDNIQKASIIHSHIAQALARGCTDLFYVNMDSGEYIEYHTDDELGVLTEARRNTDFFESCKREVREFVHPDDQELFITTMNQEFLTRTLETAKIHEIIYRRIKYGRTFYVRMKISRVEDDRKFIVIAVSDVDELMKRRFAEQRIKEERAIYARLHAITGNFLCIYEVDPETDHYREFSATDDYEESFSQAKEGDDFFNTVREVGRTVNYPDDVGHFLTFFTKEIILTEIRNVGIFTLNYRIIMDGKPVYVQLKAAMVDEDDGPRLIVGLNNIDTQMRQEAQYKSRIAEAQTLASVDALTKVKNKHAYLEVEARMDHQIMEHHQRPFAVTMFDVNDLKKINDTKGHQAGDQYLCDACAVICETFKHSPVFRIGGDEFAAISQGSDYENINKLVQTIQDHNEEARRTGGVVIACGMAKFDNDDCVTAVFDRADRNMYDNKTLLKSTAGNIPASAELEPQARIM